VVRPPPGAVATTLNRDHAAGRVTTGRSAGILPAGGAASLPPFSRRWLEATAPAAWKAALYGLCYTFSTIFFANSLDFTFVAPCIWRSRS
jgi:hypothetical protein